MLLQQILYLKKKNSSFIFTYIKKKKKMISLKYLYAIPSISIDELWFNLLSDVETVISSISTLSSAICDSVNRSINIILLWNKIIKINY